MIMLDRLNLHRVLMTVGWMPILILGLNMTAFAAPPGDGPRRPLVAAFHVHSTASTGSLSLDQLAEQAEQLGLDAVILSDNFVLRLEYGLPPLRRVFRKTVSLPSVLDYGVERYLADIAAVQARHPGVLLIPGVEVMPHYYWTGSLLERNLTMHNSQKNLLVLGLSRAEDYAALPIHGNFGSYRYGWETALNVTPGLLLIPAAWLWRHRSHRTVLVGITPHTVTKRYRTPAIVLAGVAVLLLVLAWPFSQPIYSQYDDDLSYSPYQALIDAVTSRGGIVIWSMPEARDFNVYSVGPLGPVTIKTDPYPEALLRTNGYTGFGGVYQDTRSATQPGGLWDKVIRRYLTGQGAVPPFVSGEIAFHTPGQAGIELDQVLTVFWTRERTAAGILEAMRTGHMYAVHQPQKDFGLRLDTFSVECDRGARVAHSGETLERRGAQDVAVLVSVSATDEGAHPIRVTVIRSGKVIARLAGETPFEERIEDPDAPRVERTAYRVEVLGEAEIVSNPIFVVSGSAV
ncbi:hypothetical protein MYX04_03860 [Nitrospiraceae bacterium AH_259_D15_M11_P09]|nr:hypothetical protein [Nitrospiraceae bacterium AH_259_D15_M11_P09]